MPVTPKNKRIHVFFRRESTFRFLLKSNFSFFSGVTRYGSFGSSIEYHLFVCALVTLLVAGFCDKVGVRLAEKP